MKISRLVKASNFEVEQWIEKNFDLNPYQKECLRNYDMVRSSPFYFYKLKRDIKVSPLWRLTLIPWIVYNILLYLLLPFKWFADGRWGYSSKFVDKYYSPWRDKLGL